MAAPALYIRNALSLAEEGLGDGTTYAEAIGVSNSLADAQTNKRLTFVSFAPMADMGADADDLWNGYLAYNAVTGNRYHIVDWVAGTDTATLFEVPESSDIVPSGQQWEFRRTLREGESAPDAPACRAVDGYPSIPWKGRAANVDQLIDVHLQNLINRGGFEESAVGGFPSSVQPPGIWYSDDAWSTGSNALLLGSRAALWTAPGSGNKALHQRLRFPLKQGATYRLIMKAYAIGGATASDFLRVDLINHNAGTLLDATWDADGTWNVGAIGTSVAWFTSPDFIPDFDSDTARLMITAMNANRGGATSARIDEIYLWEVINVGALLAFRHNWNDAFPSSLPVVMGYRADPSRSGIGADDFATLLSLSQLSGTTPFLAEFPPAIFPIYRIALPGNALIQYEAGQILLAEKWPWLSHPEIGMSPKDYQYQKKRQETLSGAETTILYNTRRAFKGKLSRIKALDQAIWEGVFRERHIGLEEVFAAVFPGQFDTPILFKCHEAKLTSNTVRPDVDFDFLEAL